MADNPLPKFKFKKRSFKKRQLRKPTDDGTNDGFRGGDGDVVSTAETASGTANGSDNTATVNAPSSLANSGDSDDGGEEEQSSVLRKIHAVERRRKLLLGVGRNGRGGVDLADLAKRGARSAAAAARRDPSDGGADEAPATAVEIKDREERLKVNFAGGKLAGSNDMGGGDEGGVLVQKHRKAMEDFIATNLSDGNGKGSAQTKGSAGSPAAEGEASSAVKEMYAELLVTPETTGEGQPGPSSSAAGDGDTGAGGAMMGGTGIAEVALPIDDRLKALRDTQRATMEHQRARQAARLHHGTGGGDDRGVPALNELEPKAATAGADIAMPGAVRVPTNFVQGPGKRKREEDSFVHVADPSAQPFNSKDAPIGNDANGDHGKSHTPSSALPPSSAPGLPPSASSAGAAAGAADVADLGASYAHNFQLHSQEWASRRRDERRGALDAAARAGEETAGAGGGGAGGDDGPDGAGRIGFAAARRRAKGEGPAPAGPGGGGAGAPGGAGNKWDGAEGERHRSNDERVWRTFMSNQRNRR